MPTSHVAFLRAINVAGHATVAMESLRRAFERWGYRGVRTYIQSGNVLFDAPAEDAEVVARDLESRLGRLLGGEAVVCLRALAQVERLLRRDPFADLAEERGSKLYVSFLRRLPARRLRLPLAREKDGLEIVGREGRDVWVVSRPVKGRYGFPNLLVEEAFGVPATSRNWTTVRAIPARAREP